jgi:hypothetical protein
MRTTLTLDDDVAAKLTAEARKSGRSFKDVVNTTLRVGLNVKRHTGAVKSFRVHARALDARPGISFDNIEALLDQIEGANRR